MMHSGECTGGKVFLAIRETGYRKTPKIDSAP